MRRIGLIVVLALIVVAFFIGFWPQHRQNVAMRAELASTKAQLTESQSRVELGQVLGQLLEVSDAVSARDYGRAASLSSAFFDRVRMEAAAAQPAGVKTALDQILGTRDTITTALARSDPEVATLLNAHQKRLREALGYPTMKGTPSS